MLNEGNPTLKLAAFLNQYVSPGDHERFIEAVQQDDRLTACGSTGKPGDWVDHTLRTYLVSDLRRVAERLRILPRDENYLPENEDRERQIGRAVRTGGLKGNWAVYGTEAAQRERAETYLDEYDHLEQTSLKGCGFSAITEEVAKRKGLSRTTITRALKKHFPKDSRFFPRHR